MNYKFFVKSNGLLITSAMIVTILGTSLVAISCKTDEKVSDSDLADDDTTRIQKLDLSERKFFNNKVNQLLIHLHGETWRKIVTHRNEGGYACDDEAPYGHVKELKFIDSNSGESTILNNVGLRVKGNTSCDDPVSAKGFRLKFDPVDKLLKNNNGDTIWRFNKVYEEWGKRLAYPDDLAQRIKKQSLFGLNGIALRRGSADETRLRDAISARVFAYGGELARRRNLPGAPDRGGQVYRSSVVWVKIHDGFSTLSEGHYGLAELIDEDFVALHFGKESLGYLYKIQEAKGTLLDSDMPSDQQRLFKWYEPKLAAGDEVESLAESAVYFQLCREGKIEQRKCDQIKERQNKAETALRALKRDIDQTMALPTIAERRAAIGAILDVDAILSYLVAVNLTGHWDSMAGAMANNDFLFKNKKTGKWSILTWDLDNTFGAGHQNYVWMANLDDFGTDWRYRPLFRAVLQNFHDEYLARAREFLDGAFHFKTINDSITELRDRIAPGSEEDKYRNLYRFAAHRYGNAWCHLNRGIGFKVKFKNGWPDIYQDQGRYVAACEPR